MVPALAISTTSALIVLVASDAFIGGAWFSDHLRPSWAVAPATAAAAFAWMLLDSRHPFLLHYVAAGGDDDAQVDRKIVLVMDLGLPMVLGLGLSGSPAQAS